MADRGADFGYHSAVLALRLLCLVAVAAVGSGCAHAVLLEPDVKNARVFVDGELVGEGAQTIERRVIIGDQLRVSAQAEGYEDFAVTVDANEWYPYPGLLALVPLLGIPIGGAVFVAGLPLLGIGIVLGPLVGVGWAVVTSPTIASLAFTRKYPDTIKIKMIRKKPALNTDGLLPADIFGVPDDVSPNPLPDVGPLPGGEAKKKKPPAQPGSGNPVP